MTTDPGMIDALVSRALLEDRAFEDITTSLLVPDGSRGEARIIAREEGVLSGQDCCRAAFIHLDPDATFKAVIPDAHRTAQNDTVAIIEGDLSAILSAERTALNFLGHLSGIATRTSLFAGKVAGAGIRILDTRKTLPGLRGIEKQAVLDGGGSNHRSDLASYVLVKENHISAAGGVEKLAGILGERLVEAEIEVTSLDELELLGAAPPGRIMLDNFTPVQVSAAVLKIDSWGGRRPEIEVSGGIDLETIDEYAIKGVDFISVGSLTSSARSLDLSLLIDQYR